MPRRSKSHSEAMAQKMRDPDFARELVVVSLELRGSIVEALRFAIRSMGIKEFSDKSGIPMANVSEFVSGNKSWGYKRLEKGLAVFGLEFSVRDKVALAKHVAFVIKRKSKT